jgi:RHS repeat-associated protein
MRFAPVAVGETTMKSIARFIYLLSCLYCLPMLGQTMPLNAGSPNWSAYDVGQYDSINLQNLSVSLAVPIMNKPGAIPFTFGLNASVSMESVFGTSIYPAMALAPVTPSVNGTLGVLGYTPAIAGYSYAATGRCPSADGTGYATAYNLWFVQLADGTVHAFPTTFWAFAPTSTCSGTYTSTAIDGSGYTLTLQASIPLCPSNGPMPFCVTVIDRSGNKLDQTTFTNPQSAASNITWAPNTGIWTDSLGLHTLTQSSGGNSWNWTDVNGGSPTASVTTTSYTARSVFGCSSGADINIAGEPLPTAITFPDSTSLGLAWEPTPGYLADRTGRLAQITMRDGSSTVSFNYNPTASNNDGLNCTYLVPNSMTRTTSDGTVTYTWTSFTNGGTNYGNYTTKLDSSQNKTVYTFTGLSSNGVKPIPTVQALTEVQYFHNTGTIASPTYSSTADRTNIYCYNTSSPIVASCQYGVMTMPITEVDVFTAFAGQGTNYSRRQTMYDGYGNVTYVAQYDFGSGSPSSATATSFGSWTGSTCVPVGNNINDKPCQITVTSGTSTISVTRFAYNSHGNLLTTYVSPNGGSTFLSNATANSYNSNGTPSALYDVANNKTTYAYSSSGYVGCGTACIQYPFPTTITNIGTGLTELASYNAIGGVKLNDVGPNGTTQTTTYSYQENCGSVADPWWRVGSVTDPSGNIVCKAYSADSVATTLSFNSGVSVNNTVTTMDGYGRTILQQRQQGPASGNYDTVSQSYVFAPSSNPSWHGTYSSIPCTGVLGSGCTDNIQHFYDMLERPVKTYNSGNTGYTTNAYSGGTSGVTREDVLQVLGPAPGGEGVKQVQREYDGLGRLTSVCAISSAVSGNVSCGQVTNASATGVLTTTAYTSSAGSRTVSSTRGVQTRSTTVDGLGRVTSITTPEGGTTTYGYDAAVCGWPAEPGYLTSITYANGASVCVTHNDALGRLTDMGLSGGANPYCKRLRYDSTANGAQVQPPGSTISNPGGRLVEAETDTCGASGGRYVMITDEWFSYDKNGHVTDVWQLTPHSGGYYHSTASYYANGQLGSLGIPGLGTVLYTVDGEGRLSKATQGTLTLVSGVTYSPLGPTQINIGSGTDNDTYGYSTTTGRMSSFQFNVGTKNLAGTLNWNPNGTLGSLALVDGFSATNTQTCAFSYDDITRLVSDQCGAVWSQTYQYDQYDNLNQFGNQPWTAPYYPANNHYNLTGASYDASGNLTSDAANTYTYDSNNKLASAVPIGTSCSSTTLGGCYLYDAFGNAVELSDSTGYYPMVYGPAGKTALMSGQTLQYAYIPTPGRGSAVGWPTGMRYTHVDWLGTGRVSSYIPASGNGTMYYDRSFAPYGQMYGNNGPGSAYGQVFTGDTGDLGPGMFDTPNRELAQNQGRWLTPDPAHAGWNQYAYPTNPNSYADPSGLDSASCSDPHIRALCQAGISSPYSNFPALTPGFSSLGSWDEFDLFNIPITTSTYTPAQPISTPITSINNEHGEAVSATLFIPGGWSTTTIGNGGDLLAKGIFAGLFFPGQNGALQAAANAAKNFMKKPITNPPPTIPSPPEDPPSWPDDFQSDETKLAAAALDVLGDILGDVLIIVDPCLANPRLRCGPFAPPQL